MSICTLFDLNYSPQGLAMYRSFRLYHPTEPVTICAIDEATARKFSVITDPNLHLCTPSDLLGADILDELKASRTFGEYCWGLAAPLVLYCLLRDHSPVEYIDADGFFFSDLSEVRNEIGAAPIGIVPHRWDAAHRERLAPNGTYNVGYVYFSGDSRSIAAAQQWMASNVNWTRRTPEDRFNDQLHLEDWPDKHGAHVVTHPGINLAPYNQQDRTYSTDWESLLVDGRQLVMYHFHEWKYTISEDRRHVTVSRTGYPLALPVQRFVYDVYEPEVVECMKMLEMTSLADVQ